LGDADRLRQVILNLLSNAVKFTDYGRVDLLVEPGPGGRTVFSVTDTGIGVPEERQRDLFQRFTQIDRSRGGAGLGLAICRRLVELMGGTVGVRSRPGAGSTFWFAIPLPIAPADDADAPPESPAAYPRPRRILVVEDVAMNRELAVAVLRNAGFTVDAVGDGAAALAAVQRTRYDVVLMDVEMPGMDGLEAARAIRALSDPIAANTTIIALTAVIAPADAERCYAAGMNGHIAKPLDREELLAALRRAEREDEATDSAAATTPAAATA
ncbi:MAG TPA: ATP-binding protein, partial [Azospirillaceae bacterium]|nr:ATP-binding protein [Azospirillaceae bacterium]